MTRLWLCPVGVHRTRLVMILEDLGLSGIDRTLGGSLRSLPLERPVSRYHAASGFFPVSFSVMSGDPYINLIRSRVYPNRRHRRPEPPQLQPALAPAPRRRLSRASLCCTTVATPCPSTSIAKTSFQRHRGPIQARTSAAPCATAPCLAAVPPQR